MKSSELLRVVAEGAALSGAYYSDRNTDGSDYLSRQTTELRARATRIMNVIQWGRSEKPEGLEPDDVTGGVGDRVLKKSRGFDLEARRKRQGNTEDLIVARGLHFVRDAHEIFNNFVPEDTILKQRTFIGVHDVYGRYLEESDWGEGRHALSLDVVTELELWPTDPEAEDLPEGASSHADEVQTLERLNWDYPVYDSVGHIFPLENCQFGPQPMLRFSTLARAYSKIQQGTGIEALVTGMHASLDLVGIGGA